MKRWGIGRGALVNWRQFVKASLKCFAQESKIDDATISRPRSENAEGQALAAEPSFVRKARPDIDFFRYPDRFRSSSE
jgi:hypothetical protein